jgi:hypothetical protein
MRSVLLLVVFVAFIVGQVLTVSPQQKRSVSGNETKINFLCNPCKQFFTELKKYLPEVSEITRDVLKQAIEVSLFNMRFYLKLIIFSINVK